MYVDLQSQSTIPETDELAAENDPAPITSFCVVVQHICLYTQNCQQVN